MLSPTTLARVLRGALTKPQGDLRGAEPAALCALPAVEGAAIIRPEAVARYRAACSLGPGEAVPICFAETLFLGPMAQLITRADFPLNPLGLIHTRQQVRGLAAIPVGVELQLRCRVAAVEPGERGVTVDCAMEVARGGEPLWLGTATLLSRSARARGRRGAGRPPKQPFAPPPGEPQRFEVPAGTGRAYARASGDYNPHHLSRLTALPFGFRRPIAHGMWTLARALGLLEQQAPLGPEVAIDAAFKRPLLMPARVAYAASTAGADTELAVFHPERHEPYLLARVSR